jgi:hypothetical protein
MKKITAFAGIVVLALFLAAWLPAPVFAAAGDITGTGTVTLTPTIECIGVIAHFTGDSNQNNFIKLEYRVSGGAWLTGMDMYCDRSPKLTLSSGAVANTLQNTYRASIIGLTANTLYEVRLTFTDADGVTGINPVTAQVATRNDNPVVGNHYYYVSTSGRDSNNGADIEHPFLTIQKAADIVIPGDTVLVRGGIYTGTTVVSRSGTALNYITFEPYGREQVILDAKNTKPNMFDISANYVRVKGFTLQNSAYSKEGGLIRLLGAAYCIIEDNTLIDPAGIGGMNVRNGASNNLIQRNIIKVTTRKDPNQPTGIYGWKPGGANVIRNNTFNSTTIYGLWDGIGWGPENQTGYMNDSDFNNNTITFTAAIDPENWWDRDDGIQLDGDGVNVRVWNNRIENALTGFSACPCEEGPLYVFRNVIINSTGEEFKLGDSSFGREYFYHNTFYTINAADGYKQTNAGIGNLVSRNNIVCAGRKVIEINYVLPNVNACSWDYDNLYTSYEPFAEYYSPASGGGASTLDGFRSIGIMTHGFSEADNKFVNVAGADFQLQGSSPDIDKGLIIPGFNDADSPWPYQGAAPDLGAYEYGASSSVGVIDSPRVDDIPIPPAVTSTLIDNGTRVNITTTAAKPVVGTVPPTLSAPSTPPAPPFPAALENGSSNRVLWIFASAIVLIILMAGLLVYLRRRRS